jgi:hypothetical protein
VTQDPLEGFIELCDVLLVTAAEARAHYERVGSTLTIPIDNLVRMVEIDRQKASDGTLRRPTLGGPPFGFNRFLGDYEWRPDGEKLVEAALALERYWKAHL